MQSFFFPTTAACLLLFFVTLAGFFFAAISAHAAPPQTKTGESATGPSGSPATSPDTSPDTLPGAAPSGPPAASADAPAKLPEIVVTASAEPADVKSIPASVQVIDAKEIKRSGADDLAQLLTRTSATQVLIQPGNYAQVSLRGFKSGKSVGGTLSDQVLLLIDGNRSGTGNINNIPIANIERVEILRGPASVLYGGSAVGGVINVITKRGKGKPGALLGAQYGSFDQYSGHAGVHGGLNDDRWGFSVATQTNNSNDYKTGNGDKYENSEFHSAGGGGTLTFRPDSKSSISGVFNFQNVYDTGSPGDVYFSTPNSSVKDKYLYGALEFDSTLDSGISLRGSVYGNQNVYDDINREEFPYTSRYDARMGGVRTILGLPLAVPGGIDLGRLSVGTEYARNQLELSGNSISEPDSSTDIASVFAEHKFSISSLSFQYGLRYDRYDTSTKETEALDMQSGSRNFEQMTWSAGATWWMLDWLGIRSSVGTAYVPPTSMQLAGEYSSWGTTYRGNADLKAEKSLTADVGLEFDRKGLNGNIGYFQTKYTDRITTEMTTPGVADYVNQGRQHVSGIEGMLNYSQNVDTRHGRFTLSPYARWEYLTERSNGGSDSSTSVITDLPKYTATAGLGLGWDKMWLDLNAQMTGEHTGYDFADDRYKEFDSFTIYNARLTITPMEKLSVYLDVQNLEDKYYGYKEEFPMPGRSFTVGFSYEY